MGPQFNRSTCAATTPAAFFITARDLQRTIATPHAPRVFDVRRRQAFDADTQVIPGARWQDSMACTRWGAERPLGQPMVVACVHGHNVSQLAASTLRRMGHHARVLQGGVEGWKAQGGLMVAKAPGLGPLDADRPPRDPSGPTPRSSGPDVDIISPLGPSLADVACLWLLIRFVAPDAQVQFVDAAQVGAVGEECGAYALPVVRKAGDAGANADHRAGGGSCVDGHAPATSTFDTLLERLDLRARALTTLAAIVRGAAAEAAGIARVHAGFARLAQGDDAALLRCGLALFDGLFAEAQEREDTAVAPASAHVRG
ncbi:MAG: chromate resistance protein ChrB domain-containing protein [Pseudomonadota bacterium]